MVTLSSVVSSLIAAAIWFAGAFICVRLYKGHRILKDGVAKLVAASERLLARPVVNEELRAIEIVIEQYKHLLVMSAFVTTWTVVADAALEIAFCIHPTLTILIAKISFFVLFCFSIYLFLLLFWAIYRFQSVLADAALRNLCGMLNEVDDENQRSGATTSST